MFQIKTKELIHLISLNCLCALLTSCGVFDLDLFQRQISNAVVTPPPVAGGNCTSPYVFAQQGIHAQIDATINGINNRDITFSRNAGSGQNSGNYENVLDLSFLIPNTGKVYAEMTITAVNDNGGTDWTEIDFGVLEIGFANFVAIGIDLDFDFVYWVRSVGGVVSQSVVFSGQNIRGNLPYTVGLTLDTSTGEVSYNDSLGNSGPLTTNVNFISNTSITLGVTGGVENVGNTISTHTNFGDTAFTLTPPTGSKDICGNSL